MRVAVGSGKGGTGKTLLSTALALVFEDCTFLDLDVEEPNAHFLLHPEMDGEEDFFMEVPRVIKQCSLCGKCAEVCEFNAIWVGKEVHVLEKLCHGCGSCIHFCPEAALEVRKRKAGVVRSGKRGKMRFIQGVLTVSEALSPPLIRYINKNYAREPFIIDCPPGNSCPFVNSITPADFVILVTEPTPFGLEDLKGAVEVVKDLGKNFGVVINRATLGDERIRQKMKERFPVLMEIPFDRRIAESYAKGENLLPEMMGDELRKLLEAVR